jgi:signal transduction histidine kinase
MSVQAEDPGVANNGSRMLRVLLVEDSQADSLLLAHALERGGYKVVSHRVDNRESMTAALARQPWDVILADHAMPRFSAPEALELVKQYGLDVPFIIVSGFIEEETAVAAMRAGAHDYVMKDRLARLVPAVERELREAEVRRGRASYAEQLRRASEELEARVEKRTADLKAANLKLQKVLEEQRRLENELLEIAENERRSIGFDLHDDLGQKLTGASLMIKGLEQKLSNQSHPACADARRIQELIENIIHHTHNLAHQFSSLDQQGDNLGSTLDGLAASVRKMFSIACNFHCEGTVPDLPANTLLQLYKIAQEAVSNAIKHGKASRVTISVACTEEHMSLAIRNDGKPFAIPAGAKNRMGLRIMKYRANTIGADLDIQGQPEGGTSVTCVLPIPGGTQRRRRHESARTEAAASPRTARAAARS